MYTGQIVTIRGREYEILEVNWSYGTVICKECNCNKTNITDFSFDELEEAYD